MTITRPTLLLDEKRCRRNIQFMAEKAQRHGLKLRPHFKTHLSREVGQWFREAGVDRITVSSVEMAEYFAPDWDDITIAFPVNVREIEAINRLAGKVKLNVLVESQEAIAFLDSQLAHTVGAWIKLDVGTHRTGVSPENEAQLFALLQTISLANKLTIKGFLAHAGHTYQVQGEEAIEKIHQHTLALLRKLSSTFKAQIPDIQLSLGDTPGCSISEDFEGIDEIRPGNFAFYDLMQERIGSNTADQIAVALACPVVALHPEREELVVYGGAVHFSKDRIPYADTVTYGQVVEQTENGWGKPLAGMYAKRLSQEHGIIAYPKSLHGSVQIGDLLYILPVHSCLTANLAKHYLTLDGRKIEKWQS